MLSWLVMIISAIALQWYLIDRAFANGIPSVWTLAAIWLGTAVLFPVAWAWGAMKGVW